MINIITFQRYENETDDELIYRVCSQKDIIGTWKDVCDILNELTNNDYNESAYRKKYQIFEKMLSANQTRFASIDAQLEEISLQKRELEKERKKLQAEKLEYNKWLREDARDELITEKIIDAITTLPPLPPLKTPRMLSEIPSFKSYLLCLADAHYGIEFDIKDFYGATINEYNPEIFEKRMDKLLRKVIEIIQKENIEELNIWELGDGIQGILRLNSQLMKLKYGVIDSSIRYACYLAEWINALSDYTRVRFQMVIDSNHNQLRLCNAPKNAFTEENMSKVMLLIIKERLKDNPNVEILDNPTGMNFANLSGYSILGIHGETKDLGTALLDMSKAYHVSLDYIVGAHVHHSVTKEVGIDSEAISVRSIVGVDPYGMSLNRTSNAGASLLVFDIGEGLVCDYKIKLN